MTPYFLGMNWYRHRITPVQAVRCTPVRFGASPLVILFVLSIIGVYILSEKSIEKKIKDHIFESGGYCVKIHADGMQGTNTVDLLGHYRGKPFFIDVKTPQGTISKAQEIIAYRFKQGGYVTGFVTSLDEFKELFR